MDIAIGAWVDIIARAEVAGQAAFGAGTVVVLGEIDGAVGVDAFNPHDVAINTRSAVGDSVWGGRIVDDVAKAGGSIAPVFGVTPGRDIDTVEFLGFPAGVASTLTNITANYDVSNVVSRTAVCIRIGIIAFTDDTVAVVVGDFGGDLSLHGLAGGDSVTGVSFGIVLITCDEDGLLVTFAFDLGTAGFGRGNESIDAELLGGEVVLETADSFGRSSDLGLGIGLTGLFFGVVAERIAAGEEENRIAFFFKVGVDKEFGESGLLEIEFGFIGGDFGGKVIGDSLIFADIGFERGDFSVKAIDFVFKGVSTGGSASGVAFSGVCGVGSFATGLADTAGGVSVRRLFLIH